MNFKKYAAFSAAIIMLCFSGCSDEDTASLLTTESAAQTTTTATTTTVTTTTPPTTTTTPEITTQEFIPDTPTARDYEYESELVFVGDSVCKGLKVYANMLSDTQVYAEGSAGARSITEYEFPIKGGTYTALEAIQARQPKFIYMWMGMNDINMTTKEVYAENLKSAADMFLEASPYSKIIFVSITPISQWHEWQESDANERINTYNEYTKAFVEELDDDRFSYLDVHSILCDDSGFLPDVYQSGDGLHLSPYAYQLVLGYVSANQIGYYSDFPIVTTAFPTVETPVQGTTAVTSTAPTQTEPPEGETTPDETTVPSDLSDSSAE